MPERAGDDCATGSLTMPGAKATSKWTCRASAAAGGGASGCSGGIGAGAIGVGNASALAACGIGAGNASARAAYGCPGGRRAGMGTSGVRLRRGCSPEELGVSSAIAGRGARFGGGGLNGTLRSGGGAGFAVAPAAAAPGPRCAEAPAAAAPSTPRSSGGCQSRKITSPSSNGRGCSSANGGGGFGSEVSNANGGRAVGRCGATFGGSGAAVGGGGGTSAWIGGADGRGSGAGVWGGGPGAGTDPAELAAPDPPRSGCGDVWPPATGPDWAASGWPMGGDERVGMVPSQYWKFASYHSYFEVSTTGGV